MRGLFGDFGTMPLSDLVVYLGNKKVSGTLSLQRGGTKKQVWLRRGMILNASSNEPREYLGQFLINMGHISEEDFNRAYEVQQETKIFLGKILVMIGAVTEETVMNALSLKFRETLLDAFHWNEGNFDFDATVEPEPPQGLDFELDLLDVHREGEFRQTAWTAIRAAFPSGDSHLELVESNIPEPPKAGSLDERLFSFIREGRTIDEIILALHATDFYLYQRLYALYRLEAVRVAVSVDVTIEEDAFELPQVTETASDPVASAESLLSAGNFGEAEALARKAHEQQPSPATSELLKRAEAGLAGELRKSLMDGGKVASLLVPAANLRTLQLTAPERYLLSRVDGRRGVAGIVHVSPLRELDALKFFQRFVSSGLVRVG